MKLKSSILVFMILILLPIKTFQSKALNNIILNIGGQVVENSIVLEIKNCNRTYIDKIKNTVNQSVCSDINVEIKDEYLDLYEKAYINISTNNAKVDINKLKDKIITSINTNENNINTYYCTKGKIHNSNYINRLNDVLQIIGSKKIDIIKSDNGYFGTAYTGYFKSNVNANEKVDMNFSINEYTSGTYVIIGTPIITCSY